MAKFSELCQSILVFNKHNSFDPFINGITSDSRKVKKNYIFAAIKGSNQNGTDFIVDAVKRGAKVVLVEKGYKNPFKVSDCIFFQSKNVRKTYAIMADNYYKKKPALMVGVTGTNGKTSTAWFTNRIWTLLGEKSASIGTLGVDIGSNIIKTNLTTPDPVVLSKTLRNLENDSVKNTIIEVSSHGLSQHRLDGIKFSISAITSLGRDHLDYHISYSQYVNAKLKLFSELTMEGGIAIINSGIKEFSLFKGAANSKNLKVITVGSKNNSDWNFKINNSDNNIKNIELLYKDKKSLLKTDIVGDFQISNLVMSIAIAVESGLERNKVEKICSTLKAPPGRLERVGAINRSNTIFVDYAHTPDALESALIALRPYVKNRLILVFGCGGDRDKGKRSLMGKIAHTNADKVFVTDDNPRNENPSHIRSEIISKCPGCAEIPDRKEAIYKAIKELKRGDVLLIAGKGHETTQVIKENSIYFNDKEVVQKIIKMSI